MSKDKEKFENPIYLEIKKDLDNIGPGMCLAKWTQVTLQLQSGHNHSCHHPRTHKISEKEIERNPSALHNTRYKKLRRKEMLQGSRPEECDYCWNVEDNSDRFSDRIFKSGESWSFPFKEEIFNSNWRDDYNPKYVEVSFSNACNFKCSYCGPAYSSTWMEEIQQYGAFPTLDNFNAIDGMKMEDKMPIPLREHNPYVDAFWKWWPDLYRDLHTFRITGGEPLMSKDTWKVLDFIIEHPNPNRELKLAFNSNLGVPDVLIDKFIQKQTTDWIDALIESIKLGQHNETMINEIKTRIGDNSKFIGKVIERVRVMQTESQEGSTTAQPTSQPSSPRVGENPLGARLER